MLTAIRKSKRDKLRMVVVMKISEESKRALAQNYKKKLKEQEKQ